MRVGIMTEFPSDTVQSGPAIHTRFLKQGLMKRGHDVTLMGPDTRKDTPIDHPDVHLCRAFGYPTHPKVKIPMPGSWRTMWNAPKVDLIHSQTNTHMVHYAVWMRKMWKIPVLNTHTVHLPTHSHNVLSDRLNANPKAQAFVRRLADRAELNFAKLYNMGDTLIVQSRHFVDYWRQRGVTIPIEVVGRPIDPNKFDAQPGSDPFPTDFTSGKRLLVVCRHDREKRLDHLIDIFAQHLAPADPELTLTLIGDGFDHSNLVKHAQASGVFDRIHFTGEIKHGTLVDWYAHADLFVYTSVSETFGNVVNEALWCGLPVVALDDRMGVAHQVVNEVNGFLIKPDQHFTDEGFAAACLLLTRSETLRQKMSQAAMRLSRANSHPDVTLARFEKIYSEAKAHCDQAITEPLSGASRLRQALVLAGHLATWTAVNGVLLAIAHTMTRFGAGRDGAESQHAEVLANLAQQKPPTLDGPQRSAA